jgi:hypothetical protein
LFAGLKNIRVPDDGAFTQSDGFGKRLQIDFGFTAAGYPVKQKGFPFSG